MASGLGLARKKFSRHDTGECCQLKLAGIWAAQLAMVESGSGKTGNLVILGLAAVVGICRHVSPRTCEFSRSCHHGNK